MNELSLDERTLAKELGINLAHVRRLHDGSWSSISRSDLQAVMSWAKKHDRQVLTVEPSPLWQTLPESDVLLVRGLDDDGNPLRSDSQVEALLVGSLKDAGCHVDIVVSDKISSVEVEQAMQERNCIFIGSPKHNQASEHSMAAMFGLKAGDLSAANVRRAPFEFVLDEESRRPSAFCNAKSSGGAIGVRIRTSGAKSGSSGHLMRVDYHAAAGPVRAKNKGNDVGVLVVCRQPLGTSQNVTTIVLAGYSGFATQDMAQDIVADGLRIEKRDVLPGQPVIRVLAAKFKKTTRRFEERERVLKGRRWYGPPWSQLPSPGKKR